MSETLAEQRMRAAEASGGTSPQTIKQLVLRLVRQHGLKGRFLDFGAGRGELLRVLANEEGIDSLSGADILERPAELRASVAWHQQDLNAELAGVDPFDVVICSEVIEHLENPRQVFRNLHKLLVPGGALVLTTPNQESIRSYVALIFGGHFVSFLGASYPAHITALLREDLRRICAETGFGPPSFTYSSAGAVPKLTRLTWQGISFGLLKGRLWSDNIGLVTRRL